MYLEFIGVGEAFDPELGSSCSLLKSKKTSLLIDCGYACLGKLFSKNLNPNEIQGIYITHFHADHIFGMIPLLASWKVRGREDPLTIIGQPGIEERIKTLMAWGYPKTYGKLPFTVEYIETTQPVDFRNLHLRFSQSDHSVDNYAVTIASENEKYGISGDGGLTPATRKLFENCTYLVHEAFGLDSSIKGHTTAREVITYAQSLSNLKGLALVHIQRDERRHKLEEFKRLADEVDFSLYLPEAGSTLP